MYNIYTKTELKRAEGRSSMIKIALCDDEKEVLDSLSLHIEKYVKIKDISGIEIFSFTSVGALKSALDSSSFDIFILDVYIGEDMGTTLAREIRRRGIESPIIFLTSSVEHAPSSFEIGTLRYLIKPINPVKLYEALDAALLRAERMGERLIRLKTENGVESVNSVHITYSEAHAHYQYVMLEDGRQLKVRSTVSELYGILVKNGGFVRVGSAYIINLRYVKNVSTGSVTMYSGVAVPIPRGKHNDIKRAFWDFQCEREE